MCILHPVETTRPLEKVWLPLSVFTELTDSSPWTVTGLPKPDFSFTYKPSLTTLFRFSALTFNGHHIHLDKDYAQDSEGYPGTSLELACQQS